jgi:hypothetical protein
MQKMRYTLLASTTAVLATVGLSACGGSPSTAATPTATTSAAPSAPDNGAAGARAQMFSDPMVQQCLNAAGIKVPTGRPSGSPRPSDSPQPSGSPRPSGSAQPGGGAGGAGSAQMQKITAALKACGITLPARPARSGSQAPTATTTTS